MSVPFSALLRSEWTKLRTVRSTWWCLAVYAVVVLGFGWLAAAVTEEAPSADLAIAAALTGFGFGQLVLVVLGVVVGASEFTSGSAVASFASVPRRTRLLVAKTAVVTVLTTLLTVLLAAGCFLAARLLTSVPDGLSPVDAAVLRPLSLQVAEAALVVVLAVALGTLLRSVAGGVGLGVVLVLALPPLLAADGRRVSEAVSDALPALRVGEDPFLSGVAGWPAGLGVVAAWAVGCWVLGAILLQRRDV
jgi:ABC-2 type transport system permease protein